MKKSIFYITVYLLLSLTITAQSPNDPNDEVEVRIYHYQSKLISDIETIILDTLSQKFYCETIKLLSISITQNDDGNLSIKIVPTNGQYFGSYTLPSKIYYVFKLIGSDILYHIPGQYLELLKNIGHLEFQEIRKFIPFIKEYNNLCLSGNNVKYAEVSIAFFFEFDTKNGITIKPPMYFAYDKDD